MDHENYMQRCIQLALLGAGRTAPNPMVGAVLVYNNKIIGEGYHRQYGGPHAEVNCINSVKACDWQLIPKATLYVSLEPCAHFGKTPPCADLVIEKKIPMVVVGCRDPFEAVNGKGIEKLKTAGVEVISPVLEEACTTLNQRFFTFHRYRRPYVILKWAQTANLKIAGADASRLLISNDYTNRLVHRWRSEEASILVGRATALADNPSLTTRLWNGNNPVRLVIDKTLQLPGTLNILDGSVKTIVFNTIKQEETAMLSLYKILPAEEFAPQLFKALHRLNITSILIEGGAKTLQSFIDADCWDEARVITNTQLWIAGGVDAPVLSGANLLHVESLQADTISYFKPSTIKSM